MDCWLVLPGWLQRQLALEVLLEVEEGVEMSLRQEVEVEVLLGQRPEGEGERMNGQLSDGVVLEEVQQATQE